MTQNEAVAWAEGGWQSSPYARSESAGLGIDVDGYYGFQCVDFSTGYSIFLGTPLNNGNVFNAITLWNDQPGWTKPSDVRPGDVFVRDAVFNGINYGDTGIVVSVTNEGVHVIQQNLRADLYHGSPPAAMFWRFDQLKGFIRSNNVGATMASQDIVDETTIRLEFNNALLRDATPDDVAPRIAAGQTVEGLQRELQATPEHLQVLADQQYGVKSRNAGWEKQVTELTTENAALKAELANPTLPPIISPPPAPVPASPPSPPQPEHQAPPVKHWYDFILAFLKA